MMRSARDSFQHSHFVARLFILLMFSMIGINANASPTAPQLGVEYSALERPQNTDSGKKVEVIEFFAYFCPHCYRFEPQISDWVKRQGDKINFKRVHVSFNQPISQQKLYYTLEAMDKANEYQKKVFDAYHIERNQLATESDIALFVSKSGLDKKAFFDVYNSFSIQSKVSRADMQTQAYHVTGVPTLVVDGRYVTSSEQAGKSLGRVQEEVGHQAILQVLDFLVYKVQKANPTAAAPSGKPAAVDKSADKAASKHTAHGPHEPAKTVTKK